MAKEKRTRGEVIGDTALDLGKLTFAGVVLAGIFDTNFNRTILVLGGLLFCVIVMFVGVYLTTKNKEE